MYFIKYIICPFIIKFIGITLSIKLYRFQLYNPMIHHLYITLCAHHPLKSSITVCLTPFTLISLTPFPLVNILLSVSIIYLQRYMHPYVHSRFICNDQETYTHTHTHTHTHTVEYYSAIKKIKY